MVLVTADVEGVDYSKCSSSQLPCMQGSLGLIMTSWKVKGANPCVLHTGGCVTLFQLGAHGLRPSSSLDQLSKTHSR